MASVLDDGERFDGPRRPTSHRREAPRRRRKGGAVRKIRGSAVTAVVAGLAITTPLLLRAHAEDEIALGPGSTAPGAPAPAVPGKAPTPSADLSSITGGRSDAPISRDATRSAALAPSAQGSQTQGSQTQSSQKAPTSVTAGGGPTAQASPDTAAAYEAEVVALTNEQRAAHGCPALRDDPRLRAAAVGHSVDMRARGYFAHDTPDGTSPWTRIQAQGYPDPSAENIAMGQPTPQAVVEAWMNSPGHRANILSCSSKAIGVGVQFGPGGPWWTQDFGYS